MDCLPRRPDPAKPVNAADASFLCGWDGDQTSLLAALAPTPCTFSMHRWREETVCVSSLLAVAATAHPLLRAAATMTQRRLLRLSAAGPIGGGQGATSSAHLCGTAAACSSTLACRRLFEEAH